jgi:hypothetical protein
MRPVTTTVRHGQPTIRRTHDYPHETGAFNVDRPKQFSEHQYVGDKRNQVVYDVDALRDDQAHLIEELMAAQTFICFGPDTLPEARNRGYRLFSGTPSAG